MAYRLLLHSHWENRIGNVGRAPHSWLKNRENRVHERHWKDRVHRTGNNSVNGDHPYLQRSNGKHPVKEVSARISKSLDGLGPCGCWENVFDPRSSQKHDTHSWPGQRKSDRGLGARTERGRHRHDSQQSKPGLYRSRDQGVLGALSSGRSPSNEHH